MSRDTLNAKIIRRIDIAPGLIIFRVRPNDGFKTFIPGQYVALGLPGSSPRPADYPPEPTPPLPDKLVKRSYSIGSAPGEREFLEFYIAIVPTGALTSRLALLAEGSEIWIAPKIAGTFTTADVPPQRNIILVSTGTGIAPYLSMIQSPEIWTPNRKITVVQGVRYSRDFAYREQLTSLTHSNPALSYHAIVSRKDASWSGHGGYVQNLFERGIVAADPSRDHVFLCGNPAMIDDVTKLLSAKGYTEHSRRSPGNLHLEKYW